MPKKGETVVVHYRGVLNNGKQFDSSEGREPLQFTIGSGSVIPAFEKAICTMKVGEIKSITIKASDAYGPVRKDLILEIQSKKLPPGISTKVGDKLKIKSGTAEVKIVKTTESSITVDGNHELAGQDLTFTVKLIACTK